MMKDKMDFKDKAALHNKYINKIPTNYLWDKMVEKMDCKYFYYHIIKNRSNSNPNGNSIQMPRCKNHMMAIGSCRTDCAKFESNIY